jgi:hypothetical protein
MREYFATGCGQKAYRDSTIAQSGDVIGNTSRGIFIRTEFNRVVFLSSERFLNPLNVNVQPFPPPLLDVALNEEVTIGEACIVFPVRQVRIQIPIDQVHAVAAIPPNQLDFTKQKQILGAITAAMLNKKDPSRYAFVLHDYLRDCPFKVDESNTLTRFRSLSLATQNNQHDLVQAALKGFTGEGSGLTPSGDDLICGYLLAMNRWNPRNWTTDTLQELNSSIISFAAVWTTTLSANLIELAAEGEADERLILAIDSVFTGDPPPEKTVEMLISYGSSSGTDAFAGMALAIN